MVIDKLILTSWHCWEERVIKYDFCVVELLSILYSFLKKITAKMFIDPLNRYTKIILWIDFS